MKNNKSLGQHWLKHRLILDEIADLAMIPWDEMDYLAEYNLDGRERTSQVCLEIGPGLGTLTSSLLKRFEKVVAIEYDQRLAENLPKSFPGKNLEVINVNFLDFDLSGMEDDFVVVGNIPYYITSPIIEHILTSEKIPSRVVLLMQKEVAERIVDDKETLLSLFVKNRARAAVGPVVLKDEFTPPPKVDSQVLVLEPHAPEVDEEVFDLIRKGFSSPRKKLLHNLSGLKSKEELVRIFDEVNIDSSARPGDLKIADWQALFVTLQG